MADFNIPVNVKPHADMVNLDALPAFVTGLNDAMLKIGDEIFDLWEQSAMTNLKSSREEYVKAMRRTPGGDGRYEISLEGPSWVSWLEQGTGAYGMVMKPMKHIIPFNIQRVIHWDKYSSPRFLYRFGENRVTPRVFIHPGLRPKQIFHKVVEEKLDAVVDKHIGALVDKLMEDLW